MGAISYKEPSSKCTRRVRLGAAPLKIGGLEGPHKVIVMYCNSCGARLNPTDMFCGACGFPVRPAAIAPAVQPIQATTNLPRQTSPLLWVVAAVGALLLLSGLAVLFISPSLSQPTAQQAPAYTPTQVPAQPPPSPLDAFKQTETQYMSLKSQGRSASSSSGSVCGRR